MYMFDTHYRLPLTKYVAIRLCKWTCLNGLILWFLIFHYNFYSHKCSMDCFNRFLGFWLVFYFHKRLYSFILSHYLSSYVLPDYLR